MDVAVGDAHEAVAARRPHQECLVVGERRFTWAEITDRSRRLAHVLHDAGLGVRRERHRLQPWESGQDHLAVYLHNGNAYLEAMLGAFKARVAPFNVNYRYVAEELRYLLADARPRAVVFHSRFAPTLESVLDELAPDPVLLQVPDASGHPLLAGARWYEDALAAAPATSLPVRCSPDDLYILYTGGTTGRPKGVLWRQGDALVSCFGAPDVESLDALADAATSPVRALLAPPLMHGAGHWMAFRTWMVGGTVVVQDSPEHLDAAGIWATVEREQLSFLLIVGDAFARPLVDELARHPGRHDLSSLTVLLSGGAPLSVGLKEELLRHLPTLVIIDGLGSSEAGGQLTQVAAPGAVTSGSFPLTAGNVVLSADLSRVLEPGDDELGWLARSGRLALGYLGDPERTRRTYPTVDGVRYAVPGDRARLRADRVVEVLGRDSATINSGGEKVFAEEVEAALRRHPDVYDCVVAGRPSERWGSEVVAVVRLRDGAVADPASLLAAAERHLARYKLPKAFTFVDEILRSPSGKADYRWARRVAADATAVAE